MRVKGHWFDSALFHPCVIESRFESCHSLWVCIPIDAYTNVSIKHIHSGKTGNVGCYNHQRMRESRSPHFIIMKITKKQAKKEYAYLIWEGWNCDNRINELLTIIGEGW